MSKGSKISREIFRSTVAVLLFIAVGIGIRYALRSCRHFEADETVTVEVRGAVIYPGRYTVLKDSKWLDVFKMCGGIRRNGFIAENFDFHAPVTQDSYIFIPYKLERDTERFEGAQGK